MSRPDRGREIAVGVLGIDAALDRPALKLDVALANIERLAGGDADHLLDEIDFEQYVITK